MATRRPAISDLGFRVSFIKGTVPLKELTIRVGTRMNRNSNNSTNINEHYKRNNNNINNKYK